MRHLFQAAAICAVLLLASGPAFAQGTTGSVTGVVTDAVSKAPLAGVRVTLSASAVVAVTDRTGTFTLSGVPAGSYELVVTYLGHADEKATVEVRSGEVTRVTVTMSRTAYSESVSVTAAPIDEGQAGALNQQKNAPNITNVVAADQIGAFPDPNAAEATQRIPGVSITRDQGEGRYILIRGTEARLNSVMIDGERLPSPEDTRQIMLDAVPADQLQSIEVSKAVTPDMDADSIGGAVNLITRQAVGRPTALFSLAGGYNALQSSGAQSTFTSTLGRRFSNGRFGLLVGGSGSIQNRGSENFEAQYSNGFLADLQLRDYQIRRERYGVNVSADTRLGNNGSLTVKGIFNEFQDYEVNNRERFRPANTRIEHVLKNRNQQDNIRSVQGAGQHLFSSGMTLDYRVSWAESKEDQPDRLDTIFRQSRITMNPNVSPTFIDPDNIQANPSSDNPAVATLNAWETETFTSTDRDVTTSFNLRMPLATSATRAAFLKVGAKVRDKDKDNVFQATTGTPTTPVSFPQLQDTGFDNSQFLEYFTTYTKFPGIDAKGSRALFTALPASRVEVDREGDAENYDAKEFVGAGYVMAELHFGDRLLLLPGLRYERTNVDYRGNQVLYDDGGDYVATNPVTGTSHSGYLLPGMHLKYGLTPSSNFRVAYTRTLGRPNYYDLVPYEVVFQEDGEINRGNSSLVPTTSNNLDVMVEQYFQSVGMVSGGVFYKRLNDYIYSFRFQQDVYGDSYQVTQPQNGEAANLWGAELAFQSKLRFLPGPLDGLGVYANLTLTDSSATFPGRTGTATLPGQSSLLGNFALWYEKSGFSARSSWNFHGKYVDAVGDSAATDVYYDNHTQWDLSFSQRVLRQATAYVDILNLTNAPLRYYEGTEDRPIQEEDHRWWMTFGMKFGF